MKHLKLFENWEEEKKNNRDFLKKIFNYLIKNQDLIKPNSEISNTISFRYKDDTYTVMKSFNGIMELSNEDEGMKMKIHIKDKLFGKINDELVDLFNEISEIAKHKYYNEHKKKKEEFGDLIDNSDNSIEKNRLKLAKRIADYSEKFYETFNSKLIKDINLRHQPGKIPLTPQCSNLPYDQSP